MFIRGSLLLLFALSVTALADTKVVDPAGAGDYPTIQAAIDDLPATGPRTIVVRPGLYPEAVDFSARNTAATNDAQRIILMADGAGPVTVTPPAGQSAIHVHQSKFITIRGLVVTGVSGNQVAAVNLGGGSQGNEDVAIESCRIHDNGTAGNSGHGINIADGGSHPVYVVNNTIFRNKFNGVFTQKPRPLWLVNNLIVGNGTDTDPNNTLNKFGFIRSRRGPQGGHVLARPASEITLSEVVMTLEGRTAPLDCIDDINECTLAVGCAQRNIWQDVEEAVNHVLSTTTVGDLAERQRPYAQVVVPAKPAAVGR